MKFSTSTKYISDGGVTSQVTEIIFVDPAGDFYFTREAIVELTTLIKHHERQSDTIFLKSENSKVFSRGFDPKLFQFETKSLDDVSYGLSLGQKLVANIVESPAKVVAKVRGLCIGAGFEFALACREIEFGNHSRVQFPEFKLGWTTGYGGIYLLAQKFRLEDILERLVNGELVAARNLKPRFSQNELVLPAVEYDNMAMIESLIRAKSLEESQVLATRFFLNCIEQNIRRGPRH